jgi:hypothetical protein
MYTASPARLIPGGILLTTHHTSLATKNTSPLLPYGNSIVHQPETVTFIYEYLIVK